MKNKHEAVKKNLSSTQVLKTLRVLMRDDYSMAELNASQLVWSVDTTSWETGNLEKAIVKFGTKSVIVYSKLSKNQKQKIKNRRKKLNEHIQTTTRRRIDGCYPL